MSAFLKNPAVLREHEGTRSRGVAESLDGIPAVCYKGQLLQVSPSGKAPDFDSGILGSNLAPCQ